MRQRGMQLQAEHVLFGVLVAVLLIAGLLLRKDREYSFDDIEEVSYGTATIGSINEAPVDNIGRQWSPEKEEQNRRLNQKMFHDLELRYIE